MGKMNELSTILDSMVDCGNALVTSANALKDLCENIVTCGNTLQNAATALKNFYSSVKEDVKEIKELVPNQSVCRELILVKVAVTPAERQSVISIADIFRAKIVDVAPDSLMVELTGNEAKLAAFVQLLEGYTIKEIARTGITGLSRGAGDLGEYIDD